jgi:GNAT superfamily N-acetyltransferase
LVRLFSIPDEAGPKRDVEEEPLPQVYLDAFAELEHDPDNGAWVAEHDGAVVGTFHLTFIRYLANRGARVAQVENLVVDPAWRGRGIGKAMMIRAIEEARQRRCLRVQLTSNKVRKRAHNLYAQLGFEATHEGFKLGIG